MKTTSLPQKIKKLLDAKSRRNGGEVQAPPQPAPKTEAPTSAAAAGGQAASSSKNQSASTKTWDSLGLIKPILRAVHDQGFTNPTIIQELTIPVINSGRDVLASSITGSGKTAAFLIPVIQKFYKLKYNMAMGSYTKALIVCPTRELAVQCFEVFSKLNKYTNLTYCLVIGKVPLAKQEAEVRRGPDIIIATPGRITDLLKNSQSFNLDNLEMLIFDEADKLLSMGFQAEVDEIIQSVSKARQTLLFSATLDDDVKTLVKLALNKPLRVQANPDHRVSDKLTQQVVFISENTDREAVLLHLVEKVATERCIVFFKTKVDCHRAAILLGVLGHKICELHGNMSQLERVQAFEDFRDNKHNIMLATDLAARGLDIKNLQYVINFELPRELTRYIHRIGRTARAGESGTCITIVNKDELAELKKMVKSTKDTLAALKVTKEEVTASKERIYDAEQDISAIVDNEKVERELRIAEMEAEKAENMTKYREDIYSKPRREWVVSGKAKERIREEARANADGSAPREETRDHQRSERRESSRDDRRGRGGDRGRGQSRDRRDQSRDQSRSRPDSGSSRGGRGGSRGGRGGRGDKSDSYINRNDRSKSHSSRGGAGLGKRKPAFGDRSGKPGKKMMKRK